MDKKFAVVMIELNSEGEPKELEDSASKKRSSGPFVVKVQWDLMEMDDKQQFQI